MIGDRPQVNGFQTHELTADWTYVRFHAGTRGRRGNYSEPELREWAERLRELEPDARRLRVLQQRLGGIRAAERRAAQELLATS